MVSAFPLVLFSQAKMSWGIICPITELHIEYSVLVAIYIIEFWLWTSSEGLYWKNTLQEK